MSARSILHDARWVICLALLLFVPAGTIFWPAGWLFLLLMAGGVGVIGWRLQRHDPGLLKERRQRLWQKDQPFADKIFMLALVAIGALWVAAMGCDAVRLHDTHMPVLFQMFGVIGFLTAMVLIDRVMQQNSFAAPVVKLQHERQHTVVKRGLYGYVRHPMYSAMVIAFFSIALLLGSRAGLYGAVLLTALFIARIPLEERVLRDGLPEYGAYQSQVRYRLIPMVW